MNLSMILLIIGVIVTTIIIIVYFFNKTTTISTHYIEYNGIVLYKSDFFIYATSNGVNKIFYTTNSNVKEYDIDTKKTKTILDFASKGLVFFNDSLLVLDSNENMHIYNDGKTEIVMSGVSDLYDTIGGFHYKIGGVSASSNSNKAANGNYGFVSFTIK